jgi:hypothetical protein
MWLTGFDAPSLHTMYVDKPMQGAGLMQPVQEGTHDVVLLQHDDDHLLDWYARLVAVPGNRRRPSAGTVLDRFAARLSMALLTVKGSENISPAKARVQDLFVLIP